MGVYTVRKWHHSFPACHMRDKLEEDGKVIKFILSFTRTKFNTSWWPWSSYLPGLKGRKEGNSKNSGGTGLQPDHSYVPSTFAIRNLNIKETNKQGLKKTYLFVCVSTKSKFLS
jgi:hypothetical protein